MDSEEEDRVQRRESSGQFSVGGLTSGSEDELYEVDLQKYVNQTDVLVNSLIE